MTKRERSTYLLLWFFLGLLPLFMRPLWEPDEGRYAEIPREMLAAGDWLLVNETTGEKLWAYTTIVSGGVISVDMMNIKALQDGYDITHLIFGDWFGLVPGINTIRLYAGPDSSTAYAEITDARSAWR